MPYIIQRVDDGKFVGPPGAEHSYVERADQARRFTSWEEAEKDRCGNERVWYYTPASLQMPEHFHIATK